MSRLLVSLLVSCLPTVPVLAHDTWLLGRSVTDGSQSHIEFDLTSGMGFPVPETAIAPERIARADVVAGDARSDLKPVAGGTTSLKLRSDALGPGLTLATVVLEPRRLELDPAQVAEYLDELDVGASVRAAYAKAGKWRERYRKNATALVRIGTHGGAGVPARPQGLPLELIALDDPSQLSAGSGIRACLYARGKPVADHRVGLVSANSPDIAWLRTDSDGCVVFETRLPGRYMLRSIKLEPSWRPGLDWVSEFATLTLELPH